MAKQLTNTAWETIFTCLDLDKRISSTGLAYIGADDIKKYGHREPRLMSKFDSRDARPTLFKQKNLSILPVKNGEYVLLPGDGYQTLSIQSTPIQFLKSPAEKWFETLPLIPRSESQVIDLAFATGLLDDFLNDSTLRLTIRGRLRSKPFHFYFSPQTQRLGTSGVQIEVDAGYEGKKIYLIEAKMGDIHDFNIRQLYYPYRMWYEENISKDVILLLINYTNHIIAISQFQFEDFWIYSSIKFVKGIRYIFEDKPVQLTLDEILRHVNVHSHEPANVPFPQANDLGKVRDTVDLISWGYSLKHSIADFWQMDQRQSDYYANAAVYLGLIKRTAQHWELTAKGNEFVHLPTTHRNELLCKAIFCHPVFFYAGNYYLSNKSYPPLPDLVAVLRHYLPLSKETLKRRSQTVLAWLDDIVNNMCI